jgi:hypothetical protein
MLLFSVSWENNRKIRMVAINRILVVNLRRRKYVSGYDAFVSATGGLQFAIT